MTRTAIAIFQHKHVIIAGLKGVGIFKSDFFFWDLFIIGQRGKSYMNEEGIYVRLLAIISQNFLLIALITNMTLLIYTLMTDWRLTNKNILLASM